MNLNFPARPFLSPPLRSRGWSAPISFRTAVSPLPDGLRLAPVAPGAGDGRHALVTRRRAPPTTAS